MSLWKLLEAGTPEKANIVIEIPRGSRNKYEYDRETGAIELDRVLYTPFTYPLDYGFVPQTWYDDGDPIDALVWLRYPVYPGVVVQGRVIGGLRMEDDKGVDDKLLFVPTTKKDPFFKDIQDIGDVPQSLKDEIEHFFTRYKELEKKEVTVKGWFGKEEAVSIFERAKQLYQEL